jgi:hypothetical protein
LFFAASQLAQSQLAAADLPQVRVADDKKSFVLAETSKPFVPWGFNYDHDQAGRLIEDYWEKEWHKVEEDFGEMRGLGANVVRIHLQVGKFMRTADQRDDKALDQLTKLLNLARKTGLRLDLTGLACYHKKDVPAWYDKLSERDRWDVQARFWQAVAARGAKSSAVFCYDLMNEPIVPAGPPKKDWLGPAFGDKHFVQYIALDLAGRERPAVAREWIAKLAAAIRRHDRDHMITVGLVDWSLDRPGLSSGFVPDKVAGELDFVSVHLYPKSGKIDEAIDTLNGFQIGKPVLIEETFPLRCSRDEFGSFLDRSRGVAAGWIGFYWGRTPDELRKSNTIGDAMTLGWLEEFERRTRER